MESQRWSAVVSDSVTAHVLEYRHDERTLRRFFSKVDYGFEPGDCEIWTGALSDEGYGDFRLPRRTVRAHRIAWIWAEGSAPPRDTPFLDHATTCLGRFCIRRDHLEPVDNAENQRRRLNHGRTNQRLMRQTALALRDERRARGEEGLL